jgi:hypothetical protein
LVAFIDGDDTWPKDKLRRMAEEFSKDPAVILVTHGHRRVDADGVPTGKLDDTHKNIARILDVQDEYERQKMLRRSIIRREGVWFGSAYSIRRSALDLIKFKSFVVPQVESRYSYLDLVLAPFIVAANPVARIAYMGDVIFDYRIHADNSAASNTVEKQLRALMRVRSTNVLTKKCLNLTNSDPDVSKRYDEILKEYDFLAYLYTKQYVKALIQYFSMAFYLAKKGNLLKELGRFLLVVFLGPSRFLKIK